VFSVA
jgi:hypothetical protein